MSGRRLEGSKIEITLDPDTAASFLFTPFLGSSPYEKEPAECYKQGINALRRGESVVAERFFRAALDRTWPESPDANRFNHAAGYACESGKRWQTARTYYIDALRRDRALSGGRDNIITASDLSDVARMDARLGNLDEADTGFRQASSLFEKFDPAALSPLLSDELANIYREHYKVLMDKGETEIAKEVLVKAEQLEEVRWKEWI